MYWEKYCPLRNMVTVTKIYANLRKDGLKKAYKIIFFGHYFSTCCHSCCSFNPLFQKEPMRGCKYEIQVIIILLLYSHISCNFLFPS